MISQLAPQLSQLTKVCGAIGHTPQDRENSRMSTPARQSSSKLHQTTLNFKLI
ncbi:MAG: hypothetical protein SAK42_14365 [Oscillatoria sp. PMC 1076.18]|nr:hypothetical protein [Oscillatoria sp. PMC 1076.18]